MGIASTAAKLINKYGDTITIAVKTVGAEFDPLSGTYSETITNHIGKGVFQSNMVKGDTMLISSAVEVNQHSTILHNGMERKVTDVIATQINDSVIIYELSVTSDNRAK